MKTEEVKLSQIKVNAENPRIITSDKFNKLINSILVFPKMLEIRPVVVDNTFKALGGNMRTNALREISKMQPEQLAARLAMNDDFNKKTKGEKDALIELWGKWLDKPTVQIIKASELTEEERKQFIIKDNVSFGQWDYDALANKFDNTKLNDWGMDVWNANPTAFAPLGGPNNLQNNPNEPHSSEDDGAGFSGLPPELQNLDLTPADLPKIQGDDETAMERIIIVYPKERAQEIAQLIGLTSIDRVVYRIDDILQCAE